MKTIYVYESFNSDESNLMGRLYVGEGKSSDNYSFEFDENWLSHHKRNYIIDPELQLYSGRQYPVNKNIFGIFMESFGLQSFHQRMMSSTPVHGIRSLTIWRDCVLSMFLNQNLKLFLN